MADLSETELERAIDAGFNEAADQMLVPKVVEGLKRVDSSAEFSVPSELVRAAGRASLSVLPKNLKEAFEDRLSLEPGDPHMANEDGEKEREAAGSIRELLCGELLDWLGDKLEELRSWVDQLGIKGALKEIWSVTRRLLKTALLAIAGVVGSLAAAYLLIGLAVAAVAAAIYAILRSGIPNYCDAKPQLQ